MSESIRARPGSSVLKIPLVPFARSLALGLILVSAGSCATFRAGDSGAEGAGRARPAEIASLEDAEAWMASEERRIRGCRLELERLAPDDPRVSVLLPCAIGPEGAEQVARYPDADIPDIYAHDPEAGLELSAFMASPGFRRCDALTSLLSEINERRLRAAWAIRDDLALQHRDACFEPGTELPRDVLDRLTFLADFTGDRLNQVVCLGILLPDGRVATAKHCFFDIEAVKTFRRSYDPGDRDSVMEADLLARAAGMRLLIPGVSSRPLAFQIDENQPAVGGLAFHPNDPLSDFILLRVDGVEGGRGGAIARPSRFAPLVVAGFYPGTDLGEVRGALGTDALPAALAAYVVMDDTPACVIAEIQNDCLIHTCQTFPGFSGTPMFLNDGGEHPVVGLHLGVLGSAENLCSFRRSVVAPNRGVAIPDWLLR